MDTVRNIHTLKAEQKVRAAEIRADKATIKKTQRENGSGSAADLQWFILKKKRDYRHVHIAYSMLRGKTYEQIEPKCRKGNEPDQELIREIIDACTKDVCAGQA